MQDFHISTSREETFLVSFQKPLDKCYHVQRPIEKTEKKGVHARLLAQLPASSVSRNPGGNNRQERNDAVSGQEDGRQRADKEGEKIFSETMIIMAKQREGTSGQHLADSATLPSAAVKAPRA